jgi:hypothetical protein
LKQANHLARQEEAVVNGMKQALEYFGRHKRFLLILLAIIGLNYYYGFDARFTLINLLWIFISVVKIDR